MKVCKGSKDPAMGLQKSLPCATLEQVLGEAPRYSFKYTQKKMVGSCNIPRLIKSFLELATLHILLCLLSDPAAHGWRTLP